MENSVRKRISITPPEGEAVARYTVKIKPNDIMRRQVLTHTIPSAVWSAVKVVIFSVIMHFVKLGFIWLSELGAAIDERLEFPVYGWFFVLLSLLYVLWLIPQTAVPALRAKRHASTAAAGTPPEEYAFFEEGMIFSNGKDLIRIEWKMIRLAAATPLGLVISAGSVTDTLLIPPRYLCREYPALCGLLRKKLGIRFIRLKKEGRDRDPMYENPREKVTIGAPEGDALGELEVTLSLSDVGYLHSMWQRQIKHRHNRGVFGMILIFICAALMFTAAAVLAASAFVAAGIVTLAAMILYGVYLSVGGFVTGRRILVNGRDYKEPVKYIFYPAGFLMVYDNGISYVMYEDLDLIFEDAEGLGFFFSQKSCLFIPARYMHSREGAKISHFFKASLFNLDPERGRHRRAATAFENAVRPQTERESAPAGAAAGSTAYRGRRNGGAGENDGLGF